MTVPWSNRPPMTEDALLTNVLDAARKFGWKSAHFRPAKTEKGWRTAVQGDGKGFPDLVLTNGRRLLFVELKSERGKPSPEQEIWLTVLRVTGVTGLVETYIWRPAQWYSGAIEEALRDGRG